MNRIKLATELRNKLDANLTATRKLIRIDELEENELLEMIDLYEDYKVDYAYKVDDIFKYDNKLYKVIQEHTSLESWVPPELPALYLNMLPENVIPEWVQPTMAENAYNIGDKVIYSGIVYESIIDGNTWSPVDYPRGWELITP